MKIALNAMLLSGPFSGVEYAIWNLIRALRRHSAEEYLLCLPESAPVELSGDDQYQIERINLWTNSRLARIAWERFFLSGRVRRAGCDLLHCPGYVAPPGVGVPLVLTVHDCFALKNPGWCTRANRLYFGMNLGRSIAEAARILAPSRFVKEEILSLWGGIEGKIEVVPWGCGEEFRPVTDPALLASVRQQYALPEKFILFVGNLEPKKNLPGIIHGFNRFLRESRSDHRLVLAGGGKRWGGALDRLLRALRLEDKVLFPGHIMAADLPALYSLADQFVFPSLSEGFGFPVLEAMACGVPVISSRRGALSETAGAAALMVDPENYEEIGAAMCRLAGDRELRENLVRDGFQQVKAFTWEATVTKTVKIYKDLTQYHQPSVAPR